MPPQTSRGRIACLLVKIAYRPVIQEKTLYKQCAPPGIGGAQLETSRTRLCKTGGGDITLMNPFSHRTERSLAISKEQALVRIHGRDDIFPCGGVKEGSRKYCPF